MKLKFVEWIVFVVFALANLTWIYGCRLYVRKGDGVTIATLATTFLMSISTIVFALTDINKFHLLWLAPALIASSSLNFIIIEVPIFGSLYAFLVNVFGYVVTIGARKD